MVVRLCAQPEELAIGNPTQLTHRRKDAVGVIAGGVAGTYLVRHDLDHSVAAYSGAELAPVAGRPKPGCRASDADLSTLVPA